MVSYDKPGPKPTSNSIFTAKTLLTLYAISQILFVENTVVDTSLQYGGNVHEQSQFRTVQSWTSGPILLTGPNPTHN